MQARGLLSYRATMPNENPADSSPAREGHSNDHQSQASKPTAKPAPKRKVAAVKKLSVEEELAAARKLIKEGQEAEARAVARKEKEAKAMKAANGRAASPGLIERLDSATREVVAAALLGVARSEEVENTQEWLASLTTKG